MKKYGSDEFRQLIENYLAYYDKMEPLLHARHACAPDLPASGE